MAKTKAYTYTINPIGTDISEGYFVNQSSPTWVLTFVRWNVRDTLRAIPPNTGVSAALLGVRSPLVVESDCVQLTTNSNKSVLTPSMSATLVETDVNYSTAVAPGDFVFVNILNWEQDARRVAIAAHGSVTNNAPNSNAANGNVRNGTKPNSGPTSTINGINDGFKGLYKVQSVRKTIITDPQTGIKRVLIRIDGYAFTEFNNMIYYNPYLNRDNQGTDKDSLLFMTNIHADYGALVTDDNACQDLIKFLIQSFIGVGINDRGETQTSNGALITANKHFYVPQQVGSLLGVNATNAKDVYNYLFGIQLYNNNPNQTLQKGMNPANILPPNNRFYYTSLFCEGKCLLKPEYWSGDVTAWSIMNQYTNRPLNELYTCFRVSPGGRVMPTVVFRQIPFTTDSFGVTAATSSISASVTLYSQVPRWKISSALIFNSDIGRDEAARINFTQYYVQPPNGAGKKDAFISSQTASLNFVYDVNDVTRSGLRPNIIQSNFADLTVFNDEYVAKKWANIVGDSVMGGHLKMNGTLECVGIVQPIAVGDNLEYDDVVYHIEEVNHVCSIDPQSGIKSFRTNLKLSNGVSVSTINTGVEYPEMQFTNAYHDRLNDYNNDRELPGISEEQDVLARTPNTAPTNRTVNQPDAPFAQPGQVIVPTTPDESNE